MKKIVTLCLCLLFAGIAFAQQPKTPSVSITNFQLTSPTTIAFDITVNGDCSKYLYVISDTNFFQMASAMGLTQEQFLEMMASYGIQWVTATTGQVDHYTADDLEPNSTMGIYVLAKNEQNESYVTQYIFNTSQGGGTGTAELTMTLTHPSADIYHMDVNINDQTSYYWYYVLDQDLTVQMGFSNFDNMTTQDYYNLMDMLINQYGMSYLRHGSSISEDFQIGLNIEEGNDYVAVGFPFNANDQLGTYTQPIRFTAMTGVADYAQVQMKLWPNPADDVLHVSAATNMKQIRIIDMMGRVVLQESATGQESTIDVSALSAGAYVVKVATDKGTSLQQLIIRQR